MQIIRSNVGTHSSWCCHSLTHCCDRGSSHGDLVEPLSGIVGDIVTNTTLKLIARISMGTTSNTTIAETITATTSMGTKIGTEDLHATVLEGYFPNRLISNFSNNHGLGLVEESLFS